MNEYTYCTVPVCRSELSDTRWYAVPHGSSNVRRIVRPVQKAAHCINYLRETHLTLPHFPDLHRLQSQVTPIKEGLEATKADTESLPGSDIAIQRYQPCKPACLRSWVQSVISYLHFVQSSIICLSAQSTEVRSSVSQHGYKYTTSPSELQLHRVGQSALASHAQ